MEYYEIELRMGKLTNQTKHEIFYIASGYLLKENNIFKGYVALDLITGYFDETNFYLEVSNYNDKEYDSFKQETKESNLMEREITLFSTISNRKNVYCKIKFLREIREIMKQKEINKIMNEIKRIHNYP